MATDVVMGGTGKFELPPRKKPKISELPLSSAQRGSIDGMLHTFKKKGEFDALRKKSIRQYNESAQRGMFENSLRTFTTGEIDRDPMKYLKPDRRITTPLLEGAAARASIYTKTEADVDAYIDEYMANAEKALREIRREEIGDLAANEELTRGSKSDEAYAVEAGVRRNERAKQFVEAEKARKKQEAQERKKKELEALKKKQEELMRETERLQREQKRRADRDAWKAAEKERERERIRKFNEERERLKKEAEEREKKVEEERERRRKERTEREQKRLEDEALDLLLKEGKEMAAKTKRPELERSESMELPTRLFKHSSTPSNNTSKDDMRSQGLMPTSLTLKRGDKPLPSAQGPASIASRDVEKSRQYRARSPSPARSTYRRNRRDLSPHDDDHRSAHRDDSRRQSLYRDISAERAAWKARQREHGTGRGEEGEVVERVSARARSKSPDRDSLRRRRDSRSPPRRAYRDRHRSRTPSRRYRDRDFSPRRERSRSPPGIDRYVPGESVSRRARDDDDRSTRRPRDDGDRSTRRAKDEDDDRPARKTRDDGDDRDRRRSARNDDKSKQTDIDRYMPGGSGRADEVEKFARRREHSRNSDRDRHRDRHREKDRDRDRDKGREKDKGRERAEDKDSKREVGKDSLHETDGASAREAEKREPDKDIKLENTD